MTDADHRFPWRLTGLIAVLVVASTVVASLLLAQSRVGSDRTARATPSPSTTAAARVPSTLLQSRQVTVLLTVRDDQRAAVSTALLGVEPRSGEVVELMLPRDLLLPTSPPTRLSEVSDPTGATTAEEPLETLLGVRIDALVDLDRLAWSGLIDGTGSRVDVAAAEKPGAFGLVLDRVLSGLPYEPETMGELLTGLGSMARTSVTNEDASAALSLIGRGVRKRAVTREWLPVTYLRSGSSRVAVVDRSAADPVLRDLFGPSLLEPGHAGQLRVVVEPSGATLGATTWARMRLAAAGMGVLLDPPGDEQVARTTLVLPDGSPEARRAGEAVAAALEIEDADVVVATSDPTVDVRVLLGPDALLPPRRA